LSKKYEENDEENSNKGKSLSQVEQESNQNLEVFDQLKTYTDREVNLLKKIQQNQQEAHHRKVQILKENHQSYINDIQYKNSIIQSHNDSLMYANRRGIQFWKSHTDSNIYYRINRYSKRKKLNSPDELYSVLDVHVHIYDTLDKVQVFDLGTDVLLFVSEWFSKIQGDIFDPLNDLEWLKYNHLDYKNTFQYTSYLQKRSIPQQIEQIRININQQPMHNLNQINPYTQPQQPQLYCIYPSVSNITLFPMDWGVQMQNLEAQLTTQESSIKNFIQLFSKDDELFYYIMHWLARFFQTFNKYSMALVLIGESETTDIFINKIIKPIFAYRDEYLCTINDDMLKKKQEVILKDRIFYHLDTDNLSNDVTTVKNTSQLLRKIIQTNATPFYQLLDNNTSYIWGELIVTSSKDSPSPYLKDIYSRCSVFKVKSIDSILKNANIDYIQFEEFIQNDLDNFSRILAQYPLDDRYFNIVENSEKEALSTMKNGILMTPELDNNIDIFVENIKHKNVNYFINIQKSDSEMYDELVHNFNENMIAQPLLSQYFNLIYDDIIFVENTHLLDILKEKSEIFKKSPDDKSKYNKNKRYQIS